MTDTASDPADYPKRTRTRLTRAEVWMQLAMTAQAWSDSVADKPGTGTLPFAEWPADDPMRVLAARYGLTADELARAIGSVADQVETRAHAAGYDETWDD